MAQDRDSTGFHPHFSPWLAEPAQLASTLVGHHEVIRDFLAGLRAVEDGATANHVLLVGPRGIGKTHILCLVGHYVSGRVPIPQDCAVPSKEWVCVPFNEEEYAGQNSLANLLLALFSKLREAFPFEQTLLLPASLHKEEDQVVVECCFERLVRFHDEKRNRIVLTIDNLEKILQEWRDEDHQRLRSFLSQNKLAVILASAPSVFKQVIDQKAAFHDFFEIQLLHELSNEQVLELLSRRFENDGRRDEFEARRKDLSSKIPAIGVLTGGNPRLVLFLYEIAARCAFLDIEIALRRVLEELREYFVRRFDELPDQARKVLDTMAQMDGPAAPKEIADASRLSLPLVNAQLKRLKERHYVRTVKYERRKSTRYDITERLFRIWRQTATVAGRQRFRCLADFLKIYFTPEEIRALYAQHKQCLRGEPGVPREEIRRHVKELYCFQETGEGEIRHDAFARGDILLLCGRFADALSEFDAALSIQADDWDVQADRLVALGCLGQHGPMMEAMPVLLGQVRVPTESLASVCDFICQVAANCLQRGENHIGRGLFAAILGMESWHDSVWFGHQVGALLRRILDARPEVFETFAGALAERVKNEDVLRLLYPFIKAADYLRTRDLSILERLFPEIRELVLDMVRHVEPSEYERLKRFV